MKKGGEKKREDTRGKRRAGAPPSEGKRRRVSGNAVFLSSIRRYNRCWILGIGDNLIMNDFGHDNYETVSVMLMFC